MDRQTDGHTGYSAHGNFFSFGSCNNLLNKHSAEYTVDTNTSTRNGLDLIPYSHYEINKIFNNDAHIVYT